jgi:hypothetical protein
LIPDSFPFFFLLFSVLTQRKVTKEKSSDFAIPRLPAFLVPHSKTGQRGFQQGFQCNAKSPDIYLIPNFRPHHYQRICSRLVERSSIQPSYARGDT